MYTPPAHDTTNKNFPAHLISTDRNPTQNDDNDDNNDNDAYNDEQKRK